MSRPFPIAASRPRVTVSRRPPSPTPGGQRLMLALSAFTALHEMRLGRARSAEWRTLTDTIVLVQALCELGKLDARVCQPDLGVALDGLRAALEHPGGTMGLQGDALEAASRLVCVFDDALGRLAAQTIDLAAAHVVHRIRRSAARPGQPESPGR